MHLDAVHYARLGVDHKIRWDHFAVLNDFIIINILLLLLLIPAVL